MYSICIYELLLILLTVNYVDIFSCIGMFLRIMTSLVPMLNLYVLLWQLLSMVAGLKAKSYVNVEFDGWSPRSSSDGI